MRNLLRSLAAFAGLFLIASPWAPAAACSMSEEYVRPTNFELVQISDAVIVATARAERPGKDLTKVAFDVGERVKGQAPSRIEVMGRLGAPEPSDLSDISGSHPEGHAGPCNRMTFRKGGRYLLLLQKDKEGQLRPTGSAFSRINEDYGGEDSTWVRVVRRYLRIQAAAAPLEQLSALQRLAESGQGLAGERLLPAEIADIRDHLSSLSPYKPTAYLLAAYADLEQGKLPAHGVRSRAADREQSDADALARLVMGEPIGESEAEGFSAMRRRILTALANGDHPDAMPLFDRLAAERPEDPERIGLALRFFARNGAYDRAFQWVETRLMDRLKQLDEVAAMRLIGHVAEMQSAGEEGKESWRTDPRTAALWPELALSLYWYQVERFGAQRAISFGPAIRTLPHRDYRARPRLTLALAADYSGDIDEWAARELNDEKKRQAWEKLPEADRQARDDPAALPLQVLLMAWQKRHEPVLEQVFCQSGARRRLLIRTFGEFASEIYDDLLKKIASSPLSQDERALLLEAIERWGRRSDPGMVTGDHAIELIANLRQGKRPATPIECRKGSERT
ncbi:MAG TPA: hypothetical protein VF782_04565 [Allosphingosinicella sp.]